MRKIVFGLVAVAVVVAVALWASRSGPVEEAYVLTPKTAVWSRMAVVREPLATLAFGERLEVLERREDHVRVRTTAGITGWLEARHLIPPETWQRAAALRQEAAAMPLQASGATKVRTNVRLEPGRSGERIFQFLSGTKVEIVARRVVEWTQTPKKPAGEAADPEDAPAPKKEDWLLVRTIVDNTEVAGWVLGRFLAPDYPQALVDYAGAIRFVAWFKLAEAETESGPRPIWVAAGVSGGEGQPCDFTLLRVYTWSLNRSRYETAYVESNLCGSLPVRVTPAASGDPRSEARFAFSNAGRGGAPESREYQFRQNLVRRLRN